MSYPQIKGKTVLHLGCASSPTTAERWGKGKLIHINMLPLAKELYGMDSDDEAIHFLEKCGIPNLIVGVNCQYIVDNGIF